MSFDKKQPGRRKQYKKIAAVVAGLLSVLFIVSGVLICGVYFGYFHINGLSASGYPIRGIDVSHYQGKIDWNELAAQDIRFVYIKATEGSTYVDECFAENYQTARQTDLRVGAYHFFSFDSAGSTQAENFIQTVEAFDGMLPPAVDVEFYGNKEADPPKTEDVVLQLQVYLDAVEQAYGLQPIIYATYESWELYIRGQFEDYLLWIRDIWNKPDTSVRWTFWQYTNRGRLEGFSGMESYIDLNVFSGTEAEWEQWSMN